MSEGLPPVTRFNTAAFAQGWLKFVVSPAAIEKSFQLMIARLDVWFTVRTQPAEENVALPDITTSPEGLAARLEAAHCNNRTMTMNLAASENSFFLFRTPYRLFMIWMG